MSEDSSPVRVQLSLERLLWRTRGRHWDYLFLVEPHAPYGHSWYSLHKEIFANSEPRPEGECYVVGELLDEQSRQRIVFVGTAFLDDHRRDAFGRPVAHYMVWLQPDKDLYEVKKNLPQGWGHAVLNRMGYALDADAVFNTTSDDDIGIRHAFERALAATDWTIELKGLAVDPAECRDVGVIRKKTKSTINSASSLPSRDSERYLAPNAGHPNLSPASSKETWEADLDYAITQGKAWALLHDCGRLGDYFPSLLLMLQRIEDLDILERLVKSFSGSQDDEFIKVLAKSPQKHVAISYLQRLLKGFDAVVGIFVRHGRHLELSGLVEDEACALLAQQIGRGAAKTDLFIRNLYACLRSQAEKQSPSKDASNTNAVQEEGLLRDRKREL